MTGKPQPIRHGTPSGYRTHRRRGEDACEPCKQAWRLYYQRRTGKLPRPLVNKRKREARAFLTCVRGHYNELYIRKNGDRVCKVCRRLDARARNAAERSAREERARGHQDPTE